MSTDHDLPALLRQLLESGSTANPALNRLLRDYAAYHVVFVVVAGAFAVASLLVGVWLVRRARRRSAAVATLERRASIGLGSASLLVGLLFGLLVAANLSNVIDPRQGFSDAVGVIGHAPAGTTRAAQQEAFVGWLGSGDRRMPSDVRNAVLQRVSWQGPKAVGSALLLGVALWATALFWRRLVSRGRRSGGGSAAGWPSVSGGIALVGVSLILMAMTIGNAQGALAPVATTLFYG